MTPTTTLAPTRALATLLPLLARGGTLQLDARSPQGIGREQITLPAGLADVPLHVLGLIHDAWEIRVPVVLRGSIGGPPKALVAAFVVWRPTPVFSAETSWRHAVAPEAQAAIAEAIAASPLPPSALIDAGPEVVGLWFLNPVADLTPRIGAVQELLARMATVLGASLTAASEIPTLTIPIGGKVRSWNRDPADDVTIVMVDASRVYTFAALDAAFEKGDRQ